MSELLDLRSGTFHDRYGLPSISGRPDYIAVPDLLDILASDVGQGLYT